MRIGFVGHASIAVDTRGIRVLSDPWWSGPCFGTQWWVHPAPALDLVRARDPDFIYISHGHHDHLHFGTLQRLPKTAKVLVGRELDLAASTRDAGFETIELDARVPVEIAPGVRVEIAPTHAGDSYMMIADGNATCLNLNDALHAAPDAVVARTIDDLRARYGRVDYVFCGYGIASHFPACYVIPGKDRVATAARRQAMFNRRWVDIVRRLDPVMAFPFAADVAFLDQDLDWSNEPIHNTERPTAVFEAARGGATARVFDIGPGFEVEDHKVVTERLFAPVDNRALLRDHADDVRSANRVTKPTDEQVDELVAMLRATLELTRDYLRERRRDYRFLIELKGGDKAIAIVKAGNAIRIEAVPAPAERGRYDVIFTTRFQYLRRSLSTPYGYEVLFVGSGGIFTYRDVRDARVNLHRELAVMLRQHTSPPPSRFGGQPEWLYRAKRFVRRLMGGGSPDLYDLATWTVFEGQATPQVR